MIVVMKFVMKFITFVALLIFCRFYESIFLTFEYFDNWRYYEVSVELTDILME